MTYNIATGREVTTYRNNKLERVLKVEHSNGYAEEGFILSFDDERRHIEPRKLTVKQINDLLAFWHYRGDKLTTEEAA